MKKVRKAHPVAPAVLPRARPKGPPSATKGCKGSIEGMAYGGRPRMYPWRRWRALGCFILQHIIDYDCKTTSMLSMVRAWASRIGMGVTIREIKDGKHLIQLRKKIKGVGRPRGSASILHKIRR